MSAAHAPVFELTETKASLNHINPRNELHGEEKKLACDLSFLVECANTSLAMFSPVLRSSFYARDDGQGSLVDDADYMPVLKLPAIDSFKWKAGDLTGATIRFHYGTTEKSHIVLEDAKVGKFKITCREGGSVWIEFQAAVYPTEQQFGKLSKIIQDTVCVISVTPPPAPDDLDEGDDSKKQ